MRIAVVYDCLYPVTVGGGELQYRSFAQRFSSAGHQVAYLTRRQWDGEAPTMPGVRVREIAGPARLYDSSGGRRLGPAVGFAGALFRHLLRYRRSYDAVLVSALPVLNVLSARAGLTRRQIPVCADFLEVWRPEQWLEYSGPVIGRLAAALQKITVRLSPMASCHSAMNGYRLRDQGLASEPIVSPGLIEPGMSGSPHLDVVAPPVVLYAGRMIPDKRVDCIPAAIAWVRERRPDVRAQLFGDGPHRGRVAAEVRRLGLEDVVNMPGFVEESELRQAMAGAACLVNPSQREGYGLVVVEANSVGTPAVLVTAPDNASVELIDNGRNGRIAPSTSPDQLGAAILEVIEAGAPLRASTRAWFDEAVRTRTMDAAADGILAALTEAR